MANTLPGARNEAFQAVLSRIDVFRLDATNEEILELMRTLAARGFDSLSPEVCQEVVQFLARAGGERQLSMRLYEPSLKKVQYALENGIDWRDLRAHASLTRSVKKAMRRRRPPRTFCWRA